MIKSNTGLSTDIIHQALAFTSGPARLVVGFSGGLDSTVLLHLVMAWQQTLAEPVPVVAIHVNHHLQGDADRWQTHCQRIAESWGAECIAQSVLVDKNQSSTEQAARNARYHAFRQHTQSGDCLLLAHHRDDQVETVMQRLVRGSGPLGLGAMSVCSVQEGLNIVRPLLNSDRIELERYANDHALVWIEDPSNQDASIERNFLRHQVLPLWRQKKPQLNQTLARSARLCADTALMLDDLARIDLGEQSVDGGLPIQGLKTLSPQRQANAVRYWLSAQQVSAPSEANLRRILTEVIPAAEDAQPSVEWGPYAVRRFKGALYAVPEAVLRYSPQACPDASVLLHQQSLKFPYGVLNADPTHGQTTVFSRLSLSQAPLSLRARCGGETLKLPGRPTKLLKDLMQSEAVKPWLRQHWPLLYCGDTLAGLPGLWVCDGFQPRTEQDKLPLEWEWITSAIESNPRIG